MIKGKSNKQPVLPHMGKPWNKYESAAKNTTNVPQQATDSYISQDLVQ